MIIKKIRKLQNLCTVFTVWGGIFIVIGAMEFIVQNFSDAFLFIFIGLELGVPCSLLWNDLDIRKTEYTENKNKDQIKTEIIYECILESDKKETKYWFDAYDY